MMHAPCAHLIEVSHIDGEPRCELGRGFPDACQTCAAYSPGITKQEHARAEAWARTRAHGPRPPNNPPRPSYTFAEGHGHD